MQHAISMGGDDDVPAAVAMAAREITSPPLAALLWHWYKAKGDRLMPAWRDLDPSQMKAALPLIWVWGYDRNTGRFIGRLAGEEVRSIVGRPIANVPMEEYFERWNYPEIFARHKRVIDEPAIAIEKGQVFHCSDRVGFGERLILPLARDSAHADMTIAATTYQLQLGDSGGAVPLHGSPAAAPNQLGGTATQFFPL